SPEAPLIIATGPLTGTSAPCSRFAVVAKSPATGTIDDSYSGGHFGPELKYSGYDCVIIKGKSEKPIIAIIDNGEVKFEKAESYWGLDTAETEAKLTEKLGAEYKFIEIGPAGEREAPIASIFSAWRCAGRGGIGAVMGSKKVKAIAVKGNKAVRVADPERFERMAWIAFRANRMSETTVRSLPRYGTANILLTINESGALPTRNFQTGRFEGAEEISGEALKETLWKKDFACSLGCNIYCSKIAEFDGMSIDGPDYETLFSLGSNCGIDDREAICKANLLCDLYGIDTISTGGIIGFIMELYQRKMIAEQELDGLRPIWGDSATVLTLIEKIGKGEGVGRKLQEGVKKISMNYPGSESFAMHVKGLEMPAYEPRAAQGMGLCYAISERGACHLRAYTVGMELLGHGGGADPTSYDRNKVQIAVDKQDEKAVIDCSVLCSFTLFGMKLKEVFQMINPCTGFEYQSVEELKRLGARVITLTRMFNVREGFSRKDDTLPKRCLEEPLPEGPYKGQTTHLDPMINEFYQMRGWDKEGNPTKETIKNLKLNTIL
ncbi:aldehyde ferredoxin oxidoreductase family protein, partial [[Eubacterium] cellulosolvens]